MSVSTPASRAALERRERIADALADRMRDTLGWTSVTLIQDSYTNTYRAEGIINDERFQHITDTPDGAIYGLYARALEVAKKAL